MIGTTQTEPPTDAAPTALGPISNTLENELRRRVQRHGVVVWLDLDDHYSCFIDALKTRRAAGRLPYEVHAYRGSYLELLLALEGLTAGKDPPRLVLHLPGFNEDSIRETPLLELYLAGVRFRKGLDTLVTEAASRWVTLDEIAAFTGREELTLEGADEWLRARLDVQEGGFLEQLRALTPDALIDDLLRGGYVANRVRASANLEVLLGHLEVILALPRRWHAEALGEASVPEHADRAAFVMPAQDVAYLIASWALAVEYVDDLRRAPIAPSLAGVDELPADKRQACRELAAHLRDRHADFYRRAADETATVLTEEEQGARAEDLGRIDTFRFEEKAVLEAALRALEEGRFFVAAEYADARVHGGSFWLRHDLARHSAWRLIAQAAALGQAIEVAGEKLGARDHAGALARYVGAGAAVDHAHRTLEQLRLKLLAPQLPDFEVLRERLDAMRERWRRWAEAWAQAFSALCDEEGFLPPSELRQRSLFEQVVAPLAREGTTALFVIDAFRYEMGEELRRAIEGTPATNTQLHARFAELPTNTEVGMNVLAPVTHGDRLAPFLKAGKIEGFSTGEFRVKDPDTRRRAMHTAVGGTTCPWLPLAEVVARDATKLKNTVAQASLVVVHSEEIDKAGEKGVGTALFETVLQQIRVAWQLLHEAGVRRFVFTADHGFLLLDPRTTVAQSHGRKVDPKRRHVLSEHATNREGEARVTLSELGYDGVEGWDVMFPRGIAPFDTGNRRRTFVHGGNSLEERVIPVLSVVHRSGAGGTSARYRVEAAALDDAEGMHRLEAKVEMMAEQASLDFGSVAQVELAVRAELPDVSVELCHAEGAQLAGGAVRASVGQRFVVFFRLLGRTDARSRVLLHHPSRAVELDEAGPKARFAVAVAATVVEDDRDEDEAPAAMPKSQPPPAVAWLDVFEDAGVRAVFAHIETHGSCTEDVAAKMLGGGRNLRRFSRNFEKYAAVAPFGARIQSVGGVKRYVKE